MAELPPVTGGPSVEVTPQDIHDSEFGGLLSPRQKIFPTERRDIIIAGWIADEKERLLDETGRTWSALTSDVKTKTMAQKTIVLMVGVRVLRRAQSMRSMVTDSDYIRLVREVQEEIASNVLNLQEQTSPISVETYEPDLVDPDEDYSYDT